MKFIKTIAITLFLALLVQPLPSAFGFALLGPVAPWMLVTYGVYDPAYDIGGPMDIGSGYRWNTPIITYGFDESFLNYFGTNGVNAVESTIKHLNDLPPASSIVLTNYPFNVLGLNGKAWNQGVYYNLPSQTLSALLEQLGLAQPGRHVIVSHQWTPALTNYTWIDSDAVGSLGLNNVCVVMRNFDPQTLAASADVNNNTYEGVITDSTLTNGTNQMHGIECESDGMNLAVAENNGYLANGVYGLGEGEYYVGLTYDDVGGLRYLLNNQNVAYEKLLPNTVVLGSRNGTSVDGAWRPGVEKITFVRQSENTMFRSFQPLRYRYYDYYYSNSVLAKQLVVRTVYQPDILFSVADNGEGWNTYDIPLDVRTSTAQWQNNASANGNADGEGPGVIQPPIKITFHKLGPQVQTGINPPEVPIYFNGGWGAWNNPTNPMYIIPEIKNKNNCPLTIHLYVIDWYTRATITNQSWHCEIPIGGKVALQTSANQIDWSLVTTVTNTGSVIEWLDSPATGTPKYYRAVPQRGHYAWDF